MSYKREVLEVAADAGRILLENGAEIYRVEDTIKMLLANFGITEHNVYVISNAIFITVDENGDEPLNCLRNVSLGGVHLERIAAVNDLSRHIVAEKRTDTKEILEELNRCELIPPKSCIIQYMSCAVGAASFCYMLGGSVYDSFSAFLAGLLLKAFLLLGAKGNQNKYIVHILGGAWSTICSHTLYYMGMGNSLDNIIIGAIIPLVPGVGFVTSIREFFNSAYVSGTIRLIDAVLTASCIAVGVSSALRICNLFMEVVV